MALIQTTHRRSETLIVVALVTVAVIVVATLATMIFGGPAAENMFDLTTDPASGLWIW